MSRVLLILPVLVFALLGALFYQGMLRDNPSNVPSTFIGQPAPVLGSETLLNTPGFSAADFAGQVNIVNFWASWCPPCRAEHPTLKKLTAMPGVKVFGVNMMDRQEDAATFLAQDGNPYAGVVFDPKGKTRLEWGVTAPPETFIVSSQGIVLYRFIGPLVGDDLNQRFMPELQKALAP